MQRVSEKLLSMFDAKIVTKGGLGQSRDCTMLNWRGGDGAGNRTEQIYAYIIINVHLLKTLSLCTPCVPSNVPTPLVPLESESRRFMSRPCRELHFCRVRQSCLAFHFSSKNCRNCKIQENREPIVINALNNWKSRYFISVTQKVTKRK